MELIAVLEQSYLAQHCVIVILVTASALQLACMGCDHRRQSDNLTVASMHGCNIVGVALQLSSSVLHPHHHSIPSFQSTKFTFPITVDGS